MPDLADHDLADFVELDLPLHPRHASTVRAVAASVAADAHFTVDQIDDLRLGVNEAVSVLTDVDEPGDARLTVRFDLAPDRLTMTARRANHDEAVTSDLLDALAARILRAVVDEFSIGDDGAFVVVKRAAADE